MLAVINGLLSLKPVQWVLLVLAVLLIVLSEYLALQLKWVKVDLKSVKADLAWVQGALDTQNQAIKVAWEDAKALEVQKQAKAKEAERARLTAADRAAEILRLKLSNDCKEVAVWGIEQGLLQSRW